jgi:hypothetical protein
MEPINNSPPTPKGQSEEIARLENKINSLTERIISLENKLEKLESKKTLNLYGTSGKILKKEDDFQELFSFISNGNERHFRLLYSPTSDTNTKEDFHKYCDNKGSTIVLVETSNGRRFGGFTSLSWKSNDQWVNDPCACIFSFDNHKKYKLLLPQYSYYGGPGYGPHFGYCDQLGLYNSGSSTGFLDTIHTANFGTKTYDINSIEEITLTKTYVMNKFEVYQVI